VLVHDLRKHLRREIDQAGDSHAKHTRSGAGNDPIRMVGEAVRVERSTACQRERLGDVRRHGNPPARLVINREYSRLGGDEIGVQAHGHRPPLPRLAMCQRGNPI